MTLREFVEAADEQFCRMFREKGEVLPMIHLIDGSDDHIVMPIPPGDRAVVMGMIRALFKSAHVKRYVLVNESWIASPKTDEAAKRMQEYMRKNSIADHPEAKEVLMYSAEDENEASLMGMRDIIRKGGRATLGPLDLQSYDNVEGRMVGLLPRRGGLQ